MRGRWFGNLITLTMLCAAATSLRADDAADAEALKNFKHVRMLFWALDAKTGSIRGFSDVQLRPGDAVSLNPTGNYPIAFSMQPPKKFPNQFTKNADTPTLVPIKMEQPKFEGNTAQSLVYPSIELRYDTAELELRTITIAIPVGSLDSPAVAKWMEGKASGSHADLEDLLLSMARDEQISQEMLLHSCVFLNQSDRLAQWIALSKDNEPTRAMLGLIAAARLGDAASLDRFCEKCLTANLREQIKLAELLTSMQVSDKVLDTMLMVAALPDALSQPNEGAVDRRLTVVRTLRRIAPIERVQTRGRLLLERAAADGDTGLVERLRLVVPTAEYREAPMNQGAPKVSASQPSLR